VPSSRPSGGADQGERIDQWFSPFGDGLEDSSQLDVLAFAWYTLPCKMPMSPGERLEIVEALAERLRAAGRERVAKAVWSSVTFRVLSAWGRSEKDGFAAYRAAMDACAVHPPDTELLVWSQMMSPVEATAFDGCARHLEGLLDQGVLARSGRGWRVAQHAATARYLSQPSPLFDGNAPRVAIHAARAEYWLERGSEERRELLARHVRSIEVPEVPQDGPEPVAWFLEQVGDGATLTAAGYLPRALVHAAAERYPGWYLPGWVPRTEYDLSSLREIHALARSLRLVAKRGKQIALTATGRAALAGPQALWGTVIAGWVRDPFPAAVGEIAAAVLLERPASAVVLAEAAQAALGNFFRTSGGRAPDLEAFRHVLYEWLRPATAFGFVANDLDLSLEYRLTGAGRAGAASFLEYRAHAPITAL
jgi:hypothetical protein